MQNILVTGGAGYIGSHTCKKLKLMGYTPITYDNLSRGHKNLVQWGPLIEGDISDATRLESTLRKYDVHAVIHFAGLAYVGESVQNPDLYFKNNLEGSLQLLKAMQSAHVTKFVFSSSCSVYGNPKSLPLQENHPLDPINPYAVTKMKVEEELEKRARPQDGPGLQADMGIQSISLRYFNAAGADPDGETGECHEPETHLIPLAIGAALGTQKPLTVFGQDYPTEDGTCVRDYIHVSDLAQAHIAALRHLESLAPDQTYCQAFNIGTGRGHSNLEIIRAVERVTGKAVPHHLGSRRPGDPPSLIANNQLARDTLKWSPQFVELDEIIRSALKWALRK